MARVVSARAAWASKGSAGWVEPAWDNTAATSATWTRSEPTTPTEYRRRTGCPSACMIIGDSFPGVRVLFSCVVRSIAFSISRRSSLVSLPASTSCAIIGCARPPKKLNTSSSKPPPRIFAGDEGLENMRVADLARPPHRLLRLRGDRPWSEWWCRRAGARETPPGFRGSTRFPAPTGSRGSGVRAWSVVVVAWRPYYVADRSTTK